MSLYAIGDLHLHFQSQLKAPGQLTDKVWKNHEARFRKNCASVVHENDTLVLVGDHSWGRNLAECEKDGRLFFLQNNYFPYRDYALVGTKGYTFEGPFYLNRRRQITGWDEKEAEHAARLVERELERLRVSFEAAKHDGYTRFIMFLHYPPTNILERRSGFTDMAEEYGAEQVIYAHCHGQSRFHDSIQGRFHGVEYRLVSGDYLLWNPARVL